MRHSLNMNQSEMQNKKKRDAPNFIRLFVIRRVITKYISSCTQASLSQEALIKNLANVSQNCQNIEIKVQNILLQLVNDGLTKFISNWYNEKHELNIIDIIFNRIILKQFEEEYAQQTTYYAKNKNQQLLFNSSDLMCDIFQYLLYGCYGDASDCCLVSSHWLYHIFNLNSVYTVSVAGSPIPSVTSNTMDDHDENGKIRFWQRLVKCKHLQFLDSSYITTLSKMSVNQLCMLQNIEKSSGTVSPLQNRLDALETIVGTCGDKIGSFSVAIISRRSEKTIKPLRLVNVQYLELYNSYLYIIWTRQCREIQIGGCKGFSKRWCNYVIKNCDCSGVKVLSLRNVPFLCDTDHNPANRSLMKTLASKFTGIKRLKLSFVHFIRTNSTSVYVLCESLYKIIRKNNGVVEINEDIPKMIVMAKNSHVAIEKLSVSLSGIVARIGLKVHLGWQYMVNVLKILFLHKKDTNV